MKKRYSKQRQLVLDAVRARADHPTADQIYLDVRQADEKISRGTVYRNLGSLAADGELSGVRLPGADRYDYRTDRHYHLVCARCGAVLDVPMEYQTALDGQMEAQGFVVQRHRLVFEGLCPDCVRQQSIEEAKNGTIQM